MNKRFDIIGIGNALVDVLARVDEPFLARHDIEKGAMTLIDTVRAAALSQEMQASQMASGGSGANTIAGLAILGLRAGYIGKVCDDALGRVFVEDFRALGAHIDVPPAPATADAQTGRCLVMITPDGERSMATYLGISEHLGPDDIDPAHLQETAWLYLEGYRYDGADSLAACDQAIATCRQAGGQISFTLSDPFCVDRHRAEFRRLVREDVDLLFANEHEIVSLYQADHLETALKLCAGEVSMAAITAGAHGAYVIANGAVTLVPTTPRAVVDATGAGDMFASGFLYGLICGHDVQKAAQMGCLVAGEIIGQIGARPKCDLKALIADY